MIFVNQNMIVARRFLAADFIVFVEKLFCANQEVVKIESGLVLERALIAFEGAGG